MENTLPELPVQCLDLRSVEELRFAHARLEPIASADPVLSRAELPLQQTFYPLGFPLQLFTNSPDVLSLAAECWRGFHPLFEIEPMRFHVGITAGGPSLCPPAPTSRVRLHLFSHVADGENFSVSDAARAFTFMWLAESTLAHREYVRYFMLHPSAMYHLAARYAIGIHGACVAWRRNGILLCGDSGAGKSTLAYACARSGWTYTTDDGSFLVNGREDSLVVGNCRLLRFRPSAEELFPELRGRPAMQRAETGKPSIELNTAPFAQLDTAFSAPVKHVVFLNRSGDLKPDLLHFPREVARSFIFQRGIGIPEVADLQIEAVDRLLDRGVFELRYTDLHWAVERLARLAEEGG